MEHCKRCAGPVPVGRSHSEYCSKKCQASIEGYSNNWEMKLSKRSFLEASEGYAPRDLDPVEHIVSGKPIMIFSDVHCPLHNIAWIERGLRVAERLECEWLIINGDFLDLAQISKHLGSYYRRKSDLEDDFSAGELLISGFAKIFKHMVYLIGNHSQRLMRQFGGELTFERMMKMLGAHDNLKVTPRSFVDVNSNVRIVHPRQYSRLRGSTPQKLAQRWQKHIAVGHEHHSAMSCSPDARWQAVDIPCMANIELQDYIRYEINDMPEPMNGFAVIFGEKIQVFDKFTPWSLWGMQDL